MCLMEGRESHVCSHNKCLLSKLRPDYNFDTKRHKIEQRPDFSQFRRYWKFTGGFIKAVNPFGIDTPERSEFKRFQRSTCLDLFGDWPSDRDYFEKSDFRVEYVQYAIVKYEYNPLTETNECICTIDLKEAAVYCGQIRSLKGGAAV